MLQKVQDAEEQTRVMTERYQMMQGQVTSLLQERSTLSAELDTVRGNFTQLRTQMAATGADATSQQQAAEMEAKVYQSQTAMHAKSQELDAMRREMETRLADSSQFKQLKNIIKEKNGQIKTLRSQLQSLGYAVDTGGAELNADSD